MQNSIVEKCLSNYYDDCFITKTSSGTSALIAILLILKADTKKNEVLIPSVVCPSILFAVNYVGLKPVFVDMETKFFNMCIKSLKKKITKKSLAIIGVHCFGLTANIDALIKMKKEKQIFFIEDACLNFGGKIKGKYYGSFGDASILSFGYDKILSEGGGALLVKNKKKFLKIKSLLYKNPILEKIKINEKSFKKKFENLPKYIEIRKNNAKKFFLNLNSKNILKPYFRNEDVYWRYPVLFKKNREKVILSAKKKGLIITKHYPANSKYQSNSYLKNAELFDRSVLNFFLRPETKQNYIHKICKFINSQ